MITESCSSACSYERGSRVDRRQEESQRLSLEGALQLSRPRSVDTWGCHVSTCHVPG